MGRFPIWYLGINTVILVRVGSRSLIPFGVVLSQDRCDLFIRNVISTREKKVSSLPYYGSIEGLTVSKSLPGSLPWDPLQFSCPPGLS